MRYIPHTHVNVSLAYQQREQLLVAVRRWGSRAMAFWVGGAVQGSCLRRSPAVAGLGNHAVRPQSNKRLL